jgi:hypothetical protein
MRTRPVVLAALTVGTGVWLQLGVACDGAKGGGGAGGSGGASLDDVIFEGGATDEALAALLAGDVTDDPAQAAYLTTPVEGASVPTSSPVTFAWRVGAPPSGALRTVPTRRFGNGAPRPDVGPSRFAVLERPSSPVGDLIAWLGPARVAYAHGAPVNGRGYLLVIEDAEGRPLRRVFTLDLTHTPAQADWSTLTQTPGILRASVLGAVFEDNRVATDGGPWQGPETSFSFAP